MPRILVIEDEAPLCEEIASNLTFEGFEVCTANDGLTGITIAQNTPIDLILCDIMMPRVTGYEVLTALREKPKTTAIPFIFITARAGQAATRMGMALGADDYLTKPFTQVELLDAIHARLARVRDIQNAGTADTAANQKSLLGQLSHELRTPLTVISLAHGVLDMGLGAFSNDEIRDLLGRMNSGINRLDNLIEQVSLRARIDMGDLTETYVRQHSVQIELRSLVSSAVHVARSVAYRNHNVVIDIQKYDEWLMVRGITALLKLAITECIMNAINTAPEEKFISICQWETEGFASISIAVQNIGTRPKQIATIVPPFMPIEIKADIAEVQPGNLGLPIAKTLIERHGGTLSIGTTDIDHDGLTIIRLPISASVVEKAK